MQSLSFRDKQKVLSEIALRTTGEKQFLITVDGFFGSGKSGLAKEICLHLEIPYIDCDDELLRDNGYGGYAFDTNRFKEMLKTHPKLVTDCVLIRELLFITQTQADLTIYVKKIGKDNCWLYKTNQQISEIKLHSEESSIPRVMEMEIPYEKQIVNYHKEYRPQVISDLTYEREVDDERDWMSYIYLGQED